MNQFNPMAKAWSNAARDYKPNRYAMRSKKTWAARKRDLLNTVETYRRTFSDVPTGETRAMMGRDAKAINDQLFEKYLAAVDLNIKGRSLERWEIVEK